MQPLDIQLIAPSGWPAADAVARGVTWLRGMGHRVSGADSAARRHLRFAGSDAERAADINRLADPDRPLPQIVMAVRGGYGIHRILDRIDYAGLRHRLHGSPCVIVGHSDMTALSMALLARADLITFQGPMLAYDFGADGISDFTHTVFWTTVCAASHTARWQTHETRRIHAADGIDVHGTLWGGNLAVMASLAGTPYLPQIDDGILFLEDVFEPAYRIERLLYQLHHAGVLHRQRAIVLGDFSSYRADEYSNAYHLQAIIEHLRQISAVPVITRMPFGHCRDKLTLPVGARARLTVEDGTAELAFAGYPHVTAQAARASQTP